jgi:phosphoenolpyruvate-protein kinase (PTS system EI component)
LTLLVGLGLTEFSMTPGAIPTAKHVLSEVRSDDLRSMARRILRLATVEEIELELMAAFVRLSSIQE